MTTREHFDEMLRWLEQNRLKFKGMQAEFQVELAGDDGGTFWLKVDRGTFAWGTGPAARPACTVACSSADFARLASGELNPATAYVMGKVRITGDLAAALKFGALLA